MGVRAKKEKKMSLLTVKPTIKRIDLELTAEARIWSFS
jgi:hypothetical protein